MTSTPTSANIPPSTTPDAADSRLDPRRLRSLIIVNLAASVAFTAMYATQPVLPQIGAEFHVSPAQAGLTLLSVTFALALASPAAGQLTDRFGARRVMLICLAALTALSAAAAIAPTFLALVAFRAAQGLTLPGITVAGLAYLHNELPASWRGRVSGFYIGANTLGGLVSRLGVGLSVESIGWRGGMGLVAAWVGCGFALLWLTSPERKAVTSGESAPDAGAVPRFGDVVRKVWWAPLIGGTVFFPFLTIFSYATYRLEGPPFNLSPTVTSLIYIAYVLGAFGAPLAGNISDRIGRRPMIQMALLICATGLVGSMASSLLFVCLGLTLVCVGSLMAHVVANASVSQTANPLGAHARGTALALYTLGFYLGGGLGSFIPGLALTYFGWNGVVALCGASVLGAVLCSLATPRRPERQAEVEPSPTAA